MLGWAAVLALGGPAGEPGRPNEPRIEPEEQPPVGAGDEAAAGDRAQPQPEASERPVIVVRVPMHRMDGARVLEALRVHLGMGDVRVVLEQAQEDFAGLRESLRWAARTAREHGAVGVFWLDLAEGEELVISVADPSGQRVLTRTVPRDAESPAAAFEAVGIIARTTTLALVAGEEIGMRPADLKPEPKPEPAEAAPPPPAPKPEPPAPARPVWPRLWFAAEYVGTNFGDGMPWQQGIAAQIGVRPIAPLVVGVGYTFFVPDRASYPRAKLTVQRNPVTIGVGYHGRLGRRGAVEALAIGGVDPVRAESSGVEPPLAPTDDSLRVLVTAGALTRWFVYPWRTLGLHMGLGIEAVVSTFRYTVVDEMGRDEVLLEPHAVRALVTAGVSFGAVVRPRRQRRSRSARPTR